MVRQSVAVVIDLRRTVNQETGEVEYVSWGQENLQRWIALLGNAVGVDESRGDMLTLEEDSFEHSHRMEQELEELKVVQQNRNMWTRSTGRLDLLRQGPDHPAARLYNPLVHPPADGQARVGSVADTSGRFHATAVAEELPKTVEELEAEMEEQLEEELEIGAREVKKGAVLKKRITELAKAEPESFLQLIRTWLYE